eukprot:TRINITY_DN4940_c1_g1_i1.p1 TRINITY_DN4940_c1_g1~~TRINITY_DN4940_c1_g1_i1.p1  ORF type:complete len:195 (+),score=32.52 TRINITY_DN4940_c1_g1_i1:267-851(+)
MEKIEELDEESISNLSTLVLVKKSNQKVFHTLKHFSNTNLLLLEIDGNWSGVDASPLSQLINLRKLDISSTELMLPPQDLCKLYNLKQLYIGSPSLVLSQVLWGVIGSLPALKFLSLDFLEFSSDFDFHKVEGPSQFDYLYVDSSKAPFEIVLKFLRPYLTSFTSLAIGTLDLTRSGVDLRMQHCPVLLYLSKF